MADQQVSVTLRAKIDQYLQAMRQASSATGSLATDAQAKLSRLGSSMQSIGRSATLGITTPLTAAAGASVHMASQFESAFARMQGLAGVPQAEIDALQDSVMALSGETAQSPQELADALYFLRSSGLDGAEALDALEQSAMASAAGMGDTAVIADAVSSAMNAYAQSGLSAAEATDILVATARAGKAEPTELAGALGRVLPIASELGITFDDVGGAIASLSLAGNDASTSATLLQNIMSKLLKPSQAGAEALEAVGLSAQGIRDSIEEQGLLGTLEMLREKLGDNGFVRFLEDAQAVQGALALTGENASQVQSIFQDVNNATGATGEAFSAMAETDAFKMQQALADIQAAMISVGQILLPIVADITSGVAGLAGRFDDLNPFVQKVVIGLAGLAAAGGPLVFMAGGLLRNFTTLKKAFEGAGGAASKAGLAFGGIGLAIGAAVAIHQSMTSEQRELEQRTRDVAGALGEQTGAAWDLAFAAEGAAGAIDGLTLANDALGRALVMTGDDGQKIRESFGALRLNIEDVVFWMDALQGNEAVAGSALEEMGRQAGVAEPYLAALANAVMSTEGNSGLLADALHDELMNSLGLSSEAAYELAADLMPVAQAMEELDDQSEKFDGNAATREFLQMAAGSNQLANNLIILAEEQTGLSRNGEHTRSIMAALLEIIEALPPEAEAAALAALGLSGGVDALAGAAEESGGAASEATSQWSAFAHQFHTNEPFGKWIDGIRTLNEEAKALGSDKTNPFGQMWDEGLNDFLTGVPERIRQAFDEINRPVSVSSFSEALGGMVGDLDEVEDAADDATVSIDDLRGAVDYLIDSFNRLTDPGDRLREANRNLEEQVDRTAEALAEAREDGLSLAEAYSDATDMGRENQRQLEEHRDAIYDDGLAMIESGASAREASIAVALHTGALRNQMIQADYTETEVDALLQTYLLTPEQIETNLELIGAAMAAAEIASHKTRLGSIPSEISTNVKVFATGLSSVLSAIGSIPTNINIAANLAAHTRAHGGYADRPELAVWGHGPEVIFPLRNRNRILELWSDPRISGPMISALGSAASPAPSMPLLSSSDRPIHVEVKNYGHREIGVNDIARGVRRALVTV